MSKCRCLDRETGESFFATARHALFGPSKIGFIRTFLPLSGPLEENLKLIS